jgi:hypothetical protein
MMGASVRVLVLATWVAAAASAAAAASLEGAQAPFVDCRTADECRDRALEARARGEYERFHDLAWRAIQSGPANDPDLMYLLARAQALSGRRRDSLIMLRRLADMGVATDAASEEDFRRTRELAGWTDIETTFERLRAAGPAPARPISPSPATPASPAAAAPVAVAKPAPEKPGAPSALPPSPPAEPPVPSPAPAPAAAARALAIAPRPATEVVRFSTEGFLPAGLAYDEVSRRFLFGDTLGRRLFVVGEGSNRTVDLVRGESAGFHEITAIEIGSRGDLWVTSTAATGEAAGIHRLQLISGRAIETFEPPPGGRVGLRDLAVAGNGTVLVLDSGAGRVLRLRSGARTVETAMPIDVADALSLAVTDSDRYAYLAHAAGIVRLDLQARTARAVTAPAGLPLGNVERIRWHRNTLVGIQTLPDGTRGLVVLQLDRAGNAVTAGTVIDPSVDRDARSPLLTVVGDDAYYSVIDGASAVTGKAAIDVLVRRVRLR